jgi:hypothetical protein
MNIALRQPNGKIVVHQTKLTCLVPLDTYGGNMYGLGGYILEKVTRKSYSTNLSHIHTYVLDNQFQ